MMALALSQAFSIEWLVYLGKGTRVVFVPAVMLSNNLHGRNQQLASNDRENRIHSHKLTEVA